MTRSHEILKKYFASKNGSLPTESHLLNISFYLQEKVMVDHSEYLSCSIIIATIYINEYNAFAYFSIKISE